MLIRLHLKHSRSPARVAACAATRAGLGVRKAIEAVPGAVVDDVRVGSAEVALDEDTEPATVVAAVRDAGYDAVATAGRSADAKTPSSNCCGARRVTLTSLRGR